MIQPRNEEFSSFQKLLVAKSVPEKSIPFYLVRIKKFQRYLPEMPLAEQNEKNIDRFMRCTELRKLTNFVSFNHRKFDRFIIKMRGCLIINLITLVTLAHFSHFTLSSLARKNEQLICDSICMKMPILLSSGCMANDDQFETWQVCQMNDALCIRSILIFSFP